MSRRVLTPDVRDHLTRPLLRKLAMVLCSEQKPREKRLFVGHRQLTAPRVEALLGPRYARLLALVGMRLGEYLDWQRTLEDGPAAPTKSARLFTKDCPFLVWWKLPEEVFVEPVPWFRRSSADRGQPGPPDFDLRHLDLRHFDHHGLPTFPIAIPYHCRFGAESARAGRLLLGSGGILEER